MKTPDLGCIVIFVHPAWFWPWKVFLHLVFGKGEVLFSPWKSLLVFNNDQMFDSNKVFVINLNSAASLGHCSIRREDLRQIGLIGFWKGLVINKWRRFGCITFDIWRECSFLSFQSELCAWRCISWICWVMHSLHLYIFEWNFWVKVAETIFLPFIRRLGAPGDQQKSLQLQPQLSLQLDRCSLSSN